VSAFIGGGIGGQFSRRYGPKYVITVGLALEALGIWGYFAVFGTRTTFLSLLPALIAHGIGIGFATSQLTNVVLSDIPPQKAGSASGAAGMVRQVGTALGIALIGAIFVAQATSHLGDQLDRATQIPQPVRQKVLNSVGDSVGGGAPATGASGPEAEQIGGFISDSVAAAARPAVAFAGTVVTIGALLSLLVPNIPADTDPSAGQGEGAAPPGRREDEPAADDPNPAR
jgi:MFS family permease